MISLGFLNLRDEFLQFVYYYRISKKFVFVLKRHMKWKSLSRIMTGYALSFKMIQEQEYWNIYVIYIYIFYSTYLVIRIEYILHNQFSFVIREVFLFILRSYSICFICFYIIKLSHWLLYYYYNISQMKEIFKRSKAFTIVRITVNGVSNINWWNEWA